MLYIIVMSAPYVKSNKEHNSLHIYEVWQSHKFALTIGLSLKNIGETRNLVKKIQSIYMKSKNLKM